MAKLERSFPADASRLGERETRGRRVLRLRRRSCSRNPAGPGRRAQPPALATARQRVVAEHQVRGRLAVALTALFAITVVAALATAIFGSARAYKQAVDILRDLLPAELAILGSALGFYFGGR